MLSMYILNVEIFTLLMTVILTGRLNKDAIKLSEGCFEGAKIAS